MHDYRQGGGGKGVCVFTELKLTKYSDHFYTKIRNRRNGG